MQYPQFKERLAKLGCFFLAERLRILPDKLRHHCDLAAKLSMELERATSQEEFEKQLEELTIDFPEAELLLADMEHADQVAERLHMEEAVREYVVKLAPKNRTEALEIMEKTLQPEMTLDVLVKFFPKLKEFIEARKTAKH